MSLKKIIKELNNLSEIEFRILDLHLGHAKNIRAIQLKYSLSDEQLSKYLEIEISQLKSYLNGSHEFGIRDMANIDSLYSKMQKLETQRNIEKYIKENHITVNTFFDEK